MEVTVKVPQEIAAQARKRGIPVATYVENLLTQQSKIRVQETTKLRTPEEIRAWLDSLAQFSDKIPPLPETITREWFYLDHD